MSVRRTSKLSGCITRADRKINRKPTTLVGGLDYYLLFQVDATIAAKEKPLLFLVSHCETPSKREVIVEKLKEHFNITQFGSCNRNPCKWKGDCETQESSKFAFQIPFCLFYPPSRVALEETDSVNWTRRAPGGVFSPPSPQNPTI